MRRVASKFVPRLLSVDQKQQRLDVCFILEENATNEHSFLSNVITGDETWVYAYDPETKTQSSQCKVRGHLDRIRQGKWEATSSHCWFVSLIRRELSTKNLFLLVKQLMLHSTLKFWNVYGRMCEGSDLTVAGQHMAAPPWQCASPRCHPDSTVFDRWQHDCGATSSLLARPCTQRLFLISKTENEA